MGWLDCRFSWRKKIKKPRPKKEKVPVSYQRKKTSGWELLDAQLLLEHWFKGNGIR